MQLIAYLSRKSWQSLTFATVAGLASGLSGAALAALIGDAVAGHAREHAAAWFFGLCLLVVAAKCASAISLIRLAQSITMQMRIDLSRRLLATPYSRLTEIGKPQLLAIVTNDIMSFTQVFQNLPLAFSDGILIVMCLGYMAWLSWQLFVLLVVILLGGVVLYQLAERIPLRTMRQMRQQVDVLYKNFRDLIDGTRELQLNKRRSHAFVERVIQPGAGEFNRLYTATMTGFALVGTLGSTLFFLAIGLLLFVAPGVVPAPPEVLARFTLILLYLIGPIAALMALLPTLRQAGVAIERIQQLQDKLAEDAAAPASPASTAGFSSGAPLFLQMREVCHRYPGSGDDQPFALGPLNLSIGQGEIVFIIGGNGSGKTTLAMLLLGFYEADSGVISLNGVPVTRDNLVAYRQHFSAVFSDFHLFEQLLDEAQGDLQSRAAGYLQKLSMEHKVEIRDGKFSTLRLSSGQRKRLALVSAYLEDRPVYVFDEWAADQDPAFKRVFYTELLPDLRARGKTVIIISHDDAYFSCADRVIKLEDGSLRELQEPALAVGAN
ncbi:cyclic peptide export ABC transporter [Duganella sp. Root1480D1]|uniref:cyclic peptide export ABC transporter n=1 Tax=Duganella sp. Root1480D1 TaxID=1736471 RepID=UPI00070F6DFC|nr:cyclic peptide export ABC transporter [Duganella sp. Root1480D1]KQZ38941.1 ABC transporter [Duganella sp. Root1480D1]